HDVSWTTQQNFSLTRTRHDRRFGFEGIRHILNHYNPDGGGNGGAVGRFEVMTAYNWQFALYFRDRWQVTPRLTLSLGLRYELFPLQTRGGRGGIEGY